MNRPVGITIIAIGSLLGAAYGANMGMRRAFALSTQLKTSNPGLSGWGEIGAMVVVISFVFPILYALAGWGLWKLKNWARVLTIILAGIATAFELLRSLLTGHLSIAAVFSPTLFVVLIFYLTRPSVFPAFSQGSPVVRRLDQSV